MCIKKSPATASNMTFEVIQNTPVHDGPIACLAMSLDASFIATTSEKGMLVRIFDAEGQKLLKEVSRSLLFTANAVSMAYSKCQKNLCCGFDSQTVHVFNLEGIKRREEIQDDKNSSYCQRFIASPLTGAGKFLTGYNVGTVLCDYADLTFKCGSRRPVILSTEVDGDSSTMKLVIDEGFFMPACAYVCDLKGVGVDIRIIQKSSS